jgi:hypothetical protein
MATGVSKPIELVDDDVHIALDGLAAEAIASSTIGILIIF